MQRERRSILIVDSSATSIFYISTMLRQLNYAVRSVRSGEDALHVIAGSAQSVVVTDSVLPGMSGIELLKKIKSTASLRFIPVIMHSADETAATREACAKAGCSAYFVKPVEPEALFRAIQSATEATPRRCIRIPTKLKVRIGPEGAAGTGDVQNLSEGGLFVSTPVPQPVSAAVPLTLLFPTREIAATAMVMSSSTKAGRHLQVPGMGMKFTEIRSDDIDFIREFIRNAVMSDLGGKQP